MSKMLQSKFFTEKDLKKFGFRSLGKNIKISSDVRIYGQERISIGNNVRIDDFTSLTAGDGYINIGNYVYIGRNCNFVGSLGIEMRDFSSIASNSCVYSSSDDFRGNFLTAQAVPKKFRTLVGGKVTIGRHVIIGTTVVIFGKCEIGEGCSIGALSFVKNDLKEWGIYAGSPATLINKRKKDLLKLEKILLNEE